MREFFTVQEIAAVTGLTEAAVRWHCTTGRLKDAATNTGKFWVIPTTAAAGFVAWAVQKRSSP